MLLKSPFLLPPDGWGHDFREVQFERSAARDESNQVAGTSAVAAKEHLQLLKYLIQLVFRITTDVLRITLFVRVLEWVCLWSPVFFRLCSLCFPFLTFLFSTPCPAAEWHSNNEWCFSSGRLYWLWILWASLSFIMLGECFEIKKINKVDVTRELAFSVSALMRLPTYWWIKAWCVQLFLHGVVQKCLAGNSRKVSVWLVCF